MIWITPLAASVPYSVAAAGPLMTSMLSIIAGSRSSMRDTSRPPLSMRLLTRTPSM